MTTKSNKLHSVLLIASHGQNAQIVPQYKPNGNGSAVVIGYEVQWMWEPQKSVGDYLRESDPNVPKEVVVSRYKVMDPEDIAWCAEFQNGQESLQQLTKQ